MGGQDWAVSFVIIIQMENVDAVNHFLNWLSSSSISSSVSIPHYKWASSISKVSKIWYNWEIILLEAKEGSHSMQKIKQCSMVTFVLGLLSVYPWWPEREEEEEGKENGQKDKRLCNEEISWMVFLVGSSSLYQQFCQFTGGLSASPDKAPAWQFSHAGTGMNSTDTAEKCCSH